MNEYFELLHKGCSDLGVFFIDVLMFFAFVLVAYSVVVMIKYKLISAIVKAMRDEKHVKSKCKKPNKKANTKSASANRMNKNNDAHKAPHDVIDVDAIVIEVSDVMEDADEQWNSFNYR